jgi:predicted hotdog family 3-hydroxylacyl-ACP dehydratase
MLLAKPNAARDSAIRPFDKVVLSKGAGFLDSKGRLLSWVGWEIISQAASSISSRRLRKKQRCGQGLALSRPFDQDSFVVA